VNQVPIGAAILLCALGVVLWLVGGRLSRSVLVLAAVAAGTVIGMRLPGWRGWQIDGMGLAVGGAMLCGGMVFFMHRTCIGLLLSCALVLWTGLGLWIFMGGGASWDWRAAPWDGDMVHYLRGLWQTLPPQLGHVFPIACFVAMALGITIATWSPKLSKVLAHSLIGVTLIATMGTIAILGIRPQLFSLIPNSNNVQAATLIGLVLLGVMIQWQITPPHRKSNSSALKSSNAASK
jgi:hypothetical protein